jgi:hypothetical protein
MLLFGALSLATLGGLAAAFQDGMEMMMPKPVEQHTWLMSHIGTWDATIDTMGTKSKGTMTTEKGPGEFWVVSEFKGEMMGMPFMGMELLGYDTNRSEFTSVWIDSMTTAPANTRGTYDEATRRLTMTGESVGMDGQPMKMTNVTEYKDKDTMVFTMHSEMGDMTIEYKRKK